MLSRDHIGQLWRPASLFQTEGGSLVSHPQAVAPVPLHPTPRTGRQRCHQVCSVRSQHHVPGFNPSECEDDAGGGEHDCGHHGREERSRFGNWKNRHVNTGYHQQEQGHRREKLLLPQQRSVEHESCQVLNHTADILHNGHLVLL